MKIQHKIIKLIKGELRLSPLRLKILEEILVLRGCKRLLVCEAIIRLLHDKEIEVGANGRLFCRSEDEDHSTSPSI